MAADNNGHLSEFEDWPPEKQPYSDEQWAKIKLHIPYEFYQHQIWQIAFEYVNARFDDKERLELKQCGDDTEHEKQIAKYLEIEREHVQGLSHYSVKQINRWLKAINKNPYNSHKECRSILSRPLARFYFDEAHFQQLIHLDEGVRINDFEPIPFIKASKALTYPILNRFITQLVDVYAVATGKTPEISPDATKPEGYRSPFFRFLCDCVLPLELDAQHESPAALAEYARNILKTRRKNLSKISRTE